MRSFACYLIALTAKLTTFFLILGLMMISTFAIASDPFTPQAYKYKEKHGAVELRVLGQGAQRVYLFVPAQPNKIKTVPIVLFYHGWQMMNPMNFGGLIDHLVRTGHVVIYPVFQDSEKTPPAQIIVNAAISQRLALDTLQQEFNLIPQAGQTLYLGFSIGAAIAINTAIDAQKYALPAADAMILLAPGDIQHLDQGVEQPSFYERINKLPQSLPIVLMTGNNDTVGLPTGRMLAKRLCHIPRQHRIFYVLPSSSQGFRKINAGHGSPGAPDSRYNFTLQQQNFPHILPGKSQYEASASLNQLDFYGYWKMIDGLLEGLKAASFPSYVFGNGTPDQLSLGYWEDGSPLQPMRIENYCR